jgi:glycosyltransferase involved in cell wall biosynthesis
MSGPIRVLRVIARLNVGGPSLHVSYLTRGLDERGYETTLVAGTVGADEGSMEYAARELGVDPLFVPDLQREISTGHDLTAIRHLREVIRERRPHIVHTHTAKAGAVGRIAAVTAHLQQPPVIVHTFHGHVLRGYFNAPRAEVFRQVERVLACKTDRLIAVSPEVRDELVSFGVARPEKFEVIRLGLDLERRAIASPADATAVRAGLGVLPERLLIGWFGRMTEIKRVDDLLAAFAHARDNGVDAELLLAGDGPQRQMLMGRTIELGISDRTHFLGMQEEVAALYGACDLVALSSSNEGTPVSLIEALAASTPVVSTDVGGVRDVVRDGETGLLVPPGDVHALADAFARFAEDASLRERLAGAGRADAFHNYSVDRLVDDVDGLYRRLLAEKRSSGSRVGPLAPALGSLNVGRAPRKLRILLLSQYFPPEVGATQTRMQAFAEYLAARGHTVTVICEFPNHPHGVVPESYRGRLYEDDRTNDYRVLRVWVKASHEKTQRTRMQFYLSYMALATAVAPVAGRGDVVFATSPPLFTGLAGLALARLNGVPFVLDVRDLWPAAAVSLNQIPSNGAVAAGEALEKLLYKQAAAVTAVTRPFCEHIDRIRGRPPATALIPNGTLEVFFDDVEPRSELREDLGGTNGRFLVTFAGTLGIAQALPSVLEAAASADDLAFAFVGEGPLRDTLEAKARARNLDNVAFHEQVPVESIAPFLASSDALLVPLSAHETFADFVPSKLVDFMATGRPVIVSARGEAERIVKRSGGGLAIAPEDPAALVDAARWLSEHRDEAAQMGKRGRAFAATRLRRRQAERLECVLLDLVGRSPADA